MTRKKTNAERGEFENADAYLKWVKEYGANSVKTGHVQIPLAKVLTLVHNMMEPTADKKVGPELLAEYVEKFTEKDVDDFVMGIVRKLPGYTLTDGLRIAENLDQWRKRYFA
jgi:hypothetical protein